MSVRIGSNSLGTTLVQGHSALATGRPALLTRVMKRAVSTAAGIQENATEFLTDVSDAIQNEDVANKMDTKCATLQLLLSCAVCRPLA